MFVEWLNEWREGVNGSFVSFPHVGTTLSCWSLHGEALTEMCLEPCCLPLPTLRTCVPSHLENSSLSPLTLASVPSQTNHPSTWQILSLDILMPSVWLLGTLNVQELTLYFYDNCAHFYSCSLWVDFTAEPQKQSLSSHLKGASHCCPCVLARGLYLLNILIGDLLQLLIGSLGLCFFELYICFLFFF